ncbi:YfiR family protein [Pleionea sediminis]|uniref:YfiR family protein n=1 Tax=Pleionea sediminis TaxID=2569479 RepID=UPI0013DDC961|nr:YfiR family protein [Pleionea sediminis]
MKWLMASFFLVYFGLGFAVETEERIRSTILLRLPGVIYWSPDSDFNKAETQYRLCIYRDRDYFNFIKDFLRDETVKGIKIQFMFTRSLEDLKNCHVTYVGEISKKEIEKAIENNLLKETIFVASSKYSAEMGLHLRLFVGAEKTVDIEVNQKAFATNGSELKVGFLKHAKKVYGAGDVKGDL